MLTSSLNKSPKPPIIVDDIIVNELNLGSNPPSLEILEIGDLAEDRFRGIFKVKYEGDAYLTLKTRVQANPLNTFLSTKPTFASPSPLAAGSGLTIPLQITLSDIRLSGFVILVFSKQKGITLVFRNDPLESLKVSSTFDSIPFVRDYLQKTIEGQLRVLFMEDLPAIIHRLSLRVFNEEGQANASKEEEEQADIDAVEAGERPIDPFAGPAQRAVDGEEPFEIITIALDQVETYASFSQKNLLRLAALTESQRTLSLFTPSMRDTVYRAWASATERNDGRGGIQTPVQRPATLSRIQSSLNASHSAGFSLSSAASHTSDAPSHATRPSLVSRATMPTTFSSTYSGLGSGRPRTHATRKRKNRVVNLRRNEGGANDGSSDAVSVSSGYDESASRSESVSAGGSTGLVSAEPSTVPTSASAHHVGREREGEIQTPPRSPRRKVDPDRRQRTSTYYADDVALGAPDVLSPAKPRQRPVTPRRQHIHSEMPLEDADQTPRASMYLPERPREHNRRKQRPDLLRTQTLPDRAKPAELQRSSSELSISDLLPPEAFQTQPGGSNGGILEKAWMMKMATEIAKRVAEERENQATGAAVAGAWGRGEKRYSSADGGEDLPPPAYAS